MKPVPGTRDCPRSDPEFAIDPAGDASFHFVLVYEYTLLDKIRCTTARFEVDLCLWYRTVLAVAVRVMSADLR